MLGPTEPMENCVRLIWIVFHTDSVMVYQNFNFNWVFNIIVFLKFILTLWMKYIKCWRNSRRKNWIIRMNAILYVFIYWDYLWIRRNTDKKMLGRRYSYNYVRGLIRMKQKKNNTLKRKMQLFEELWMCESHSLKFFAFISTNFKSSSKIKIDLSHRTLIVWKYIFVVLMDVISPS